MSVHSHPKQEGLQHTSNYRNQKSNTRQTDEEEQKNYKMQRYHHSRRFLRCFGSSIAPSNRASAALASRTKHFPSAGCDSIEIQSSRQFFKASSRCYHTSPYPAAHFLSRTVLIPHDDKRKTGGEDAASTSSNALVVADGVGGWANQGVNPGNFSRELAQRIVHAVDGKESTRRSNATPSLKDLIQKCNMETAAQHLGSATCTTLTLTDDSPTPTLSTVICILHSPSQPSFPGP